MYYHVVNKKTKEVLISFHECEDAWKYISDMHIYHTHTVAVY